MKKQDIKLRIVEKLNFPKKETFTEKKNLKKDTYKIY